MSRTIADVQAIITFFSELGWWSGGLTMYSAQSLTWTSRKVSQTNPLYYAGIMRDVLVHFSDLFVDTSTQLLTYAKIDENI